MSKQPKLTDDVFSRLDDLLQERGWTYNRLSVESGISLNALYQMRKRQTLPSLQTLHDICVAFEISLAEFFVKGNKSNAYIIKITEQLSQLSTTSLAVLADLISCLK